MVSHNQSSSSPLEDIMMMSSRVMVAMRSKDYTSKSPIEHGDDSILPGQTSASTPCSEPLHIEKANLDMIICLPPKGMLHKSSFNPHARATQNYNIIEDLAISPSAMSTLEVLQTCPTQRKLLLSAIGVVDPQDSHLIIFDLKNHVPHLPHKLDFQIPVHVNTRLVVQTVIGEGASTCINSISCWKALGSPMINQSRTTLKAFDGRCFHPYGLLNDFLIELEGKIVAIDIEVFDAQLDCNPFLGQSLTYAMVVVVSSYLRIIMFLHKGRIVKMDQSSYYTSDTNSSNSIPFVGKLATPYEEVGVGLLKDSSLMGTFTFPPPNFPYNDA